MTPKDYYDEKMDDNIFSAFVVVGCIALAGIIIIIALVRG